MRQYPSSSMVTERATSHELIVLPALSEAQFRELSRICGVEHPGRFKEWVNDGDDNGGFRFEAAPEVFAAACSYACEEGLRFRTETSITVTYEPPATPEPQDTDPPGPAIAGPDIFWLDDDRLRTWVAEKAREVELNVDPADVTFGDLHSEDLHTALDEHLVELTDAGILRQPTGWAIGVYPLDYSDQWGYLVTVRLSNDTFSPGGAPFFQVADVSDDVRDTAFVDDEIRGLVATANRLLPLARAAAVGTDPAATHHPDGMCKAHGDYDCGEDECRVESSARNRPPGT